MDSSLCLISFRFKRQLTVIKINSKIILKFIFQLANNCGELVNCKEWKVLAKTDTFKD